MSHTKTTNGPLWPLLYFPLALLYHELLLQLFEPDTPFTASLLLYLLLFGTAAGLLIALLMSLIPNPRAYTITGSALTALWTVFTCVERCCKSYFASYFSITFSAGMVGNVFRDFFLTMLQVIAANLPFILLSLLPLVGFLLLRRKQPALHRSWKSRVLLLATCLLLQLIGCGLAVRGTDANFYTYDFNADAVIPRFGLITELRLEAQYAVTGIPQAPPVEIPQLPPVAPEPEPEPEPEPIPEEAPIPDLPEEEEAPPEPEYGYHRMESLDWEALAASPDDNIARLSQYFQSLTPSQENAYTGLFEGKNLILITAEAFSGYVIDPELTPTLYRLSTRGFIFPNFYQPGWGQSTTGGEYAVMTGLIPTWVRGNTSFYESSKKTMTFGLGHVFARLGYAVPAWHNSSWTYYGRDKTHPNLGYDYKGIGNGLTLESERTSWPPSDLEMIQVTCDSYIQDYVRQSIPFHAYYMTVSGHANYGWGHPMSYKNKEAAQAAYPEASATVQAYVGAQLELEHALDYLVKALEEADIADDTVICLCADHYPYAMASGSVDYYRELSGLDDSEAWSSRFRNTWILWCGSMEQEEPVLVEDPCSAIDIVPTLLNLFGIEYDSRLFSGRDILASNYEADKATTCMPLAILPTTYGTSWHTAAGLYEARTNTFTPNEGITVDEDYVAAVDAMVKAKMSAAALVIQSDFFAAAFGEEEAPE